MSYKYMPLMGTCLAIEMSLLNETQARTNHSQSLETLADRGGLSPCEALAIMEKRRWYKFDTMEAVLKLSKSESSNSVSARSV